MIRSPARGCCLRKRSNSRSGTSIGGGRHVGEHVGGAGGLQQRHFAERHAGRQRRQPDAVGQGDVHGAAAEEEQRRRGIAGGDDLFARLSRS